MSFTTALRLVCRTVANQTAATARTLATAVRECLQAADIQQRLNDLGGLLRTYELLAELCDKQRDAESTYRYRADAVDLAEDLGDVAAQRRALTALADSYVRRTEAVSRPPTSSGLAGERLTVVRDH